MPAEADDGGAVRVVTPTRFLDTRTGTGRPGNAPGATNTLRLAIADSGDGIYDAWAFIQRGSLRAVT